MRRVLFFFPFLSTYEITRNFPQTAVRVILLKCAITRTYRKPTLERFRGRRNKLKSINRLFCFPSWNGAVDLNKEKHLH